MIFENNAEFLDRLAQFGYEVELEVTEIAVREAMEPVLASVIASTPVSTGSRDKQSKSTKDKWKNSGQLKMAIRSVVRSRTRFGAKAGALGLVGPSYNDGGGHGNLFAPRTHKRTVFWGREVAASRVVNQFVKKAADESRGRANAALNRALKREIDRRLKKLENG
jgi:hypothetical protein